MRDRVEPEEGKLHSEEQQQAELEPPLEEPLGDRRDHERAEPRVISDCHFMKTATEYDNKSGIKRLSCTMNV
jgi:hypothetical protein